MDLSDVMANVANQAFQFGMASYSDVKSRRAIRRQNEANMKLAQYQYDLQLEQWNRANAYNSPSAQMARYKAAGLNPNLIYGDGKASAGMAASSAPAYDAPHIEAIPAPVNTMQAASSMLDQALKAAQVRKTAQETANLGVYQNNMRLEGDLKELDKIGKAYANAKSKEEAEIWRDMWENKIMNMRATGQLTDSQRFLTDKTREVKDAELGLFEYRKGVMQAQIADMMASVGLKRSQVTRISHEIDNLVADLSLKGETLTSKQLENKITSILLDSGVNLRSSGNQGLINQFSWIVGGWLNSGINAGKYLYDNYLKDLF
ncbi:DNA pilot protein [Dipodfec virus UOA04_Rod_1151]|nr:DNA pilot protein [Dipodfec virus UOA04_Rod_1151]